MFDGWGCCSLLGKTVCTGNRPAALFASPSRWHARRARRENFPLRFALRTRTNFIHEVYSIVQCSYLWPINLINQSCMTSSLLMKKILMHKRVFCLDFRFGGERNRDFRLRFQIEAANNCEAANGNSTSVHQSSFLQYKLTNHLFLNLFIANLLTTNTTRT
jgi:hypothetical protein